jgi:hypothetical protein
MTVLVGNQIEGARLLTLRSMLILEMKGMHRRGRSAYALLKDMGFKGTREKVLSELDDIRAQLLGINQEGESK